MRLVAGVERLGRVDTEIFHQDARQAVIDEADVLEPAEIDEGLHLNVAAGHRGHLAHGQARGEDTALARSHDAVTDFDVVVAGEIQQLRQIRIAPGQHGLHIHETGDCSAPDAKSAGGHFNPHKMDHGSPDKSPRHAGDFGNITVGDDGKGKLELTVEQLTVLPGDSSVVGKALVLHEKPDDVTTQPSGNSGARIGCGVINLKQ